MGTILIWLAGWSVLLWGVGLLRGNLHRRRVVKVIFFPGFLLDSVLRGLAALMTATPIKRFSPLAEGRPLLEEGRSPIRQLGPPASIAIRFFLLFTCVYIALQIYPDFLKSGFTLPLLDEATVTRRGVSWRSLPLFLGGLRDLPGELQLGSVGSIFGLYVLISALVAAGFTPREFMTSMYLWVTLYLTSVVTSWLGVKFGFFSRGWFIRFFYGETFWSTFSLIVFLTFTALALLAGGRLILSLARSMARSAVASDQPSAA